MLPWLPKGDQIKLLKFFWLKIFSICHRCRWHRWQNLSCEYLREFSKKFGTVLMEYSGAERKLIYEKNQKQKISWHCPFKYPGSCVNFIVVHCVIPVFDCWGLFLFLKYQFAKVMACLPVEVCHHKTIINGRTQTECLPGYFLSSCNYAYIRESKNSWICHCSLYIHCKLKQPSFSVVFKYQVEPGILPVFADGRRD